MRLRSRHLFHERDDMNKAVLLSIISVTSVSLLGFACNAKKDKAEQPQLEDADIPTAVTDQSAIIPIKINLKKDVIL